MKARKNNKTDNTERADLRSALAGRLLESFTRNVEEVMELAYRASGANGALQCSLPPLSKFLLVVIRLKAKDNHCELTVADLAQLTGIKEPDVKKILRDLERVDQIQQHGRGWITAYWGGHLMTHEYLTECLALEHD